MGVLEKGPFPRYLRAMTRFPGNYISLSFHLFSRGRYISSPLAGSSHSWIFHFHFHSLLQLQLCFEFTSIDLLLPCGVFLVIPSHWAPLPLCIPSLSPATTLESPSMCYQLIERYAVCRCLYHRHAVDPCQLHGRRGHGIQEKTVLVGFACPNHTVRRHHNSSSSKNGGSYPDSGYGTSNSSYNYR